MITADDIDAQHAVIINMCHSFIEQLNRTKPRHEHLVELARIIIAIRDHFQDEEQMMRDLNYFDYEGHNRAHADFMELLDNVYSDATKHPDILTHRVPLLAESLMAHISTEVPILNSTVFSKTLRYH